MKYIITGTSSGLGYCIADKLMAYGEVIGISRSYGRAEDFLHRPNYTHILHDFSTNYSGDLYKNMLAKLYAEISSDDYTLILNAACFYSGTERLDAVGIEEIFSINVFSIMNLLKSLDKTCLRRLLIINSISGLVGQGNQHEYCATKHAVMGFARSLIKSAKMLAYDVMCINPGGMKTELWENYIDQVSSDFLEPSLVADVCAFLVTRPGRVFIESMSILPPSDV